MVISVETYKRVAVEDPSGHWELVCGRLRQKPDMTTEHNDCIRALGEELIIQFARKGFRVDMGQTKIHVEPDTYYIPDLAVIPREAIRRKRQVEGGELEVYTEPLPLIVEAWSRSTGRYDVETKLREYQRRGDAEIWRLHPYERTLTTWRRQADGSYTETIYREGVVEPVALPGVRIDVAALFR